VSGANLKWVKDGYEILACHSCGLLFRAQMPTDSELEGIYDESYFAAAQRNGDGQGYSDYLSEEPNHRITARDRLRLLARFRESGSLLDVGCAAGFFLDEARQAGWAVDGIELSAAVARHAIDRLGLRVKVAGFREADFGTASFDALTMWDYIEHSVDPIGDLVASRELLTAGGILALSTGDAGSLVARVSGRRWHLLTPRHHNYFFTRQSLEIALNRSGFQLLEYRFRAGRYSPQYLLHKLRTLVDARVIRAAATRIATTRISEWGIPVNLFDIATVVARKN
jgi:SAM-dependent methyltransferase